MASYLHPTEEASPYKSCTQPTTPLALNIILSEANTLVEHIISIAHQSTINEHPALASTMNHHYPSLTMVKHQLSSTIISHQWKDPRGGHGVHLSTRSFPVCQGYTLHHAAAALGYLALLHCQRPIPGTIPAVGVAVSDSTNPLSFTMTSTTQQATTLSTKNSSTLSISRTDFPTQNPTFSNGWFLNTIVLLTAGFCFWQMHRWGVSAVGVLGLLFELPAGGTQMRHGTTGGRTWQICSTGW